MTRREFIHSLARLLGLIALPISARAAPAQPRLIQQCFLAGFQHHDGEELWSYLTVGDDLQLVRESGNLHDTHAIRIDWNGHTLGYLPRHQNSAAARLIDQGIGLEARIGRLARHDNPWRRVMVDVWMAV